MCNSTLLFLREVETNRSLEYIKMRFEVTRNRIPRLSMFESPTSTLFTQTGCLHIQAMGEVYGA